MNSRLKGAAGERELANLLKAYGYDTRRGQQYCGANGDADVVGIEGLHIECKRVERLNIDEALKQSIRDSKEGEIPVVMHRRNWESWKVTLTLDEFINLWKINEDLKKSLEEGRQNYPDKSGSDYARGWHDSLDYIDSIMID